MKDQADKQTTDMFQAKRGRGRPVTGQAQTNADRQRAYRQRVKTGAFEKRNVTENKTVNNDAAFDAMANRIAKLELELQEAKDRLGKQLFINDRQGTELIEMRKKSVANERRIQDLEKSLRTKVNLTNKQKSLKQMIKEANILFPE